MKLRFFLDPGGQNSITLMFTRKSIVMNMHKRVTFFLTVFTLNDLKQKMKASKKRLNYCCGKGLKTRQATHYAVRPILFNCYLQYRVA